MVTVAQLEGFSPGGFTGAATAWDDITVGMSSTGKMIGGIGGQLSGWEGQAASAATHTLGALTANVVPVVTLLSTVGATIRGFTSAVSAAQAQMRNARQAAVAAGCSVADDGTVAPPPSPSPPAGLTMGPPDPAAPPLPPAQQAQQQTMSQQYSSACTTWEQLSANAARWQTDIQEALHKAGGIDQQASQNLQGMTGGAGGFAATITGGREGAKSGEGEWKQFTDLVDGVGKESDYFGAGSTALVKSFESALNRAVDSGEKFLEKVDGPSELLRIVDGGGSSEARQLLATADKTAANALSRGAWADNPFVKALTKGFPEDMPGGSVLSKVPLIGAAFTAFDVFANWKDGKGIGADVKPVANLAIATGTTEAVSTLLAANAFDEVPVVGEVIIAGTVVVGVVYGADKLGQLIWDNRAAIGHLAEHVGEQEVELGKDAYHYGDQAYHYLSSQVSSVRRDLSGAVKTGQRVLHDAEPWNW